MLTRATQFLDKSCISYAALWGMKTDAHLVGDQYSWLTTIFYIGYLVSGASHQCHLSEVQHRACLRSLHPSMGHRSALHDCCKQLRRSDHGPIFPRCPRGWRQPLLRSPDCHVLQEVGSTEKKATGTRRLLRKHSLTESRDEQPFRTGIWFSMNGLANVLGGLIGYGIGFIKADIPSWKFPSSFSALSLLFGVLYFYGSSLRTQLKRHGLARRRRLWQSSGWPRTRPASITRRSSGIKLEKRSWTRTSGF